jgi:hypothetical protein
MPTNTLQDVQTYNDANLGRLINLMPMVANSNSKFKNFQNITGNKGISVDFNSAPRMTTTDSLTPKFQGLDQPKHTLTCDKEFSTSYAVDNIENVFNLTSDEAMKEFGGAATDEIAAQVESSVSNVAVESPFRCFGSGEDSDLDSYTKIAKALTSFRNFGSCKGKLKVFLPDVAVPGIIGNGLGQFTPTKNDKDVNSWQLGSFSNAEYFVSNMLPVHESGEAGQDPDTHEIKVVSINDAGDEITANIASLPSTTKAITKDTILTFDDNGGLRFLTYSGHKRSAQKVQVRLTADADTNETGQTTLSIYPPLVSTAGDVNANINKPIVADMTLKSQRDHVSGLIMSGDALFTAMPKLGSASPYDSASTIDAQTGVSLRTYHGYLISDPSLAHDSPNQKPIYGCIHDGVFGYKGVPEFLGRLAFPVSLS